MNTAISGNASLSTPGMIARSNKALLKTPVLRFSDKQENSPKTDTFSRSATLENNPVLQTLNLKSLVATSDEDIAAASRLYLHRSDQEIEASRLANLRRIDSGEFEQQFVDNMKKQTDSILDVLKKQMPPAELKKAAEELKSQFSEKNLLVEAKKIAENMKKNLSDPIQWREMVLSIMKAFSDGGQLASALTRLYGKNNPDGALVVLKNKEGNVVAMQGIHQFQEKHPEFQINQGIMEPMVQDPNQAKHALINNIFMDPNDPLYKQKAKIEQALHKATLQKAKKMDYRYVHYVTDKNNPLVKELGYQSLKPETVLENASVFTSEKIKTLMKEYNSDLQALHWKDLLSPAITAKL